MIDVPEICTEKLGRFAPIGGHVTAASVEPNSTPDGSAILPIFVILSKSFPPRAKPTRPGVLYMHVGNALAMASDMLLLVADEVARNGAFGKILRPEVFPNAPLQKLRLTLWCIPPGSPASLHGILP